MTDNPIIRAIDSLIADQERRWAPLLNDGDKLRRERMEQPREDGLAQAAVSNR
jgi:hypothetical protein